MNMVWKSLTTFFDILFPRDIRISVFDTLELEKLEQCTLQAPSTVPYSFVAPLPYRKPLVRFAVQAAKYHGHERAAKLLGETLAPFVAEELSERRMFGSFETVYIVPIPLHKTRLHERGYNQAERIASAVCSYIADTRVTLECSLLSRSKNTQAQVHSTSKSARISNIRGAFSVIDTKKVTNKDIILVDDVVTTGATLKEAQKTLYKAGARNVICVAVAH